MILPFFETTRLQNANNAAESVNYYGLTKKLILVARQWTLRILVPMLHLNFDLGTLDKSRQVSSMYNSRYFR